METVEYQSYVFLFTVYGGIIIGVLYDIYRVLSGKKKNENRINENLITSIWDVVFLLSVLLVIMWVIFSSNYGDIRIYVFIGFLVGFYLHEKILSKIAIGIFKFLLENIIYFFKTTNNLFVLPFKFIYNLLWHPIMRMNKFIKNKKIRLRKIKKLPKIFIQDSKTYYKRIIKKQIKK